MKDTLLIAGVILAPILFILIRELKKLHEENKATEYKIKANQEILNQLKNKK